jgi:hypothetical protein
LAATIQASLPGVQAAVKGAIRRSRRGKDIVFHGDRRSFLALGKEDMENVLDEFGRSLKDVISKWENILPE